MQYSNAIMTCVNVGKSSRKMVCMDIGPWTLPAQHNKKLAINCNASTLLEIKYPQLAFFAFSEGGYTVFWKATQI